ncbi:AMP-binding protein (plasmid) [Cupriavidus sp. KK10]|nr:AMP-binding protein [Cupriavidus sp. KK10]
MTSNAGEGGAGAEGRGVPFLAIPEAIRETARRHPEHLAVIHEDVALTWREFDARLDKVANALTEHGLLRGDKIAILAINSVEYLELFMGAVRAGVCVVPLSSMGQADACRDMIDDSDSQLIFVSEDFRSFIEPLLPQLGKLRQDGCIAIDFSGQGWQDYPRWVAGASAQPCHTEIDPDDDFNIIYSSGTTGKPKGILHSHYLRSAMRSLGGPLEYDRETVSLVSTPLFSNATLAGVLLTLQHGGTLVLMRKFDVTHFLRLAETWKVTHALLVPVQYQRILSHPAFRDYDLGSFRMKVSTSAPLRETIKRECLERWPGRLMEVYTLTEGGIVAVLDAAAHPDKLHTVGRAGPGCVLKILGEDGQELGPGAIGQVVGRAPLMMKGYYKNPVKTRELQWFDGDGSLFFRSGDMGKIDADGFLQLLDRQKDMIISGGFNVYPADIEVLLMRHPAVADIAVIGIPSDEWGESAMALVVLRQPASVTPAELMAWANSKLGKAERLAAVEIRESLPRSEIGKVLKRELREPYWAGRAFAI